MTRRCSVAQPGATWHDGPAALEVESCGNDPRYDEAGRVLRDALQGAVILRSRD